jgi:2-polyprenyl-3-methyl-5-hydroxy-6-metoxy-1,4-benzoquinol methylase
MTVISHCPVCSSQTFVPFQQCKDYSVSHETFQLVTCQHCSFVFTNPRPNEKEIAKYYESANYISHAKEAKTIFDRVYRIIRRFAVQWKLEIVMKRFPGKTKVSILDFGCGTGNFLEECQKKGLTVAGVEPSDSARSIANSVLANAVKQKLSEISGQFEAITLWHVLEHVPNLDEVFTALKSTLTNTGTMFIAVPNYQSYDAKHYAEHWAAYDVPRHLSHFNKHTMKIFAQKHGCKIVDIVPMKLDAYYVSMLSESYKANTKNIFTFLRGTLAGLKSNLNAQKTSEYSSFIYIIKKNA